MSIPSLDDTKKVDIVGGVGSFQVRRLPRIRMDRILANLAGQDMTLVAIDVAQAGVVGGTGLKAGAKQDGEDIAFVLEGRGRDAVAAESVFEAMPADTADRIKTYVELARAAGLEADVEEEQGKSLSSPDGSSG